MPRHLTRDPYLLLMLGLVVVPLGLYGLPQFAAANFGTLWAGHLAEPALLALTVAAFFLSPPPAARHEERQFWQLLLATCALWLAGNLAEYVAPWVGGGMPRGFLRDPLYLLSYVTLILAADLRPHLPDGWTRSALGFHFAVASTFLCVLAVILYFFTLPLLQRSGPDVGAATLNTFEALDVLLTLRFAHLAYRAARTAWAPIYACLTLAAAAAVASDGLNILIAAGSLKLGYGTLADAVWWLPMAAILTARRVRALQPQSEEPPVAVSSDEPLTDATGLLLVYALSFPATHVILGALGLPPSGWASSNFLVLGALVAFVGLAVAQQRRLERRNRDLNSRLRVLVTNEQVLQSQKMEAVGLLAGGLAHDFNNLLTVIVGRGELLATSLSQDTDRNDAREIVDTAQRAAAITKQLLTFSRRQVMRTRPMDLNAAVREGEPILRRLVGERQQVVTELADELGAIEADPSQLFQMILNLVANARDAMPDGGTVTIRTRNVTLAYGEPGVVPPTAGGSFAALTVSDTGTGIDDET